MVAGYPEMTANRLELIRRQHTTRIKAQLPSFSPTAATATSAQCSFAPAAQNAHHNSSLVFCGSLFADIDVVGRGLPRQFPAIRQQETSRTTTIDSVSVGDHYGKGRLGRY